MVYSCFKQGNWGKLLHSGAKAARKLSQKPVLISDLIEYQLGVVAHPKANSWTQEEDQFRVQSGQRVIYYCKTICDIFLPPDSVYHTSNPTHVIVCLSSITSRKISYSEKRRFYISWEMSLTPQGLEDQFRVQSGQRITYYCKTKCHIVFRPDSVKHIKAYTCYCTSIINNFWISYPEERHLHRPPPDKCHWCAKV